MRISVRAISVAAFALGCLGSASCDKARKIGVRIGSTDAITPPLAGKVELVELFAPWNPARKMQERATAEVAKKYGAWVKVTRVDIEADEEAAKRYGAEAKPLAFVILVEGKVTRRLEGLQSVKGLSAALDEALGRKPRKTPAGK
jgi:thiol-disulfide isomerase/thioredoxin